MKPVIVFDGEYIDCETGQTKELRRITRDRARYLITRMKEGDAIVLNAYEDRP
jgi:hypothetical protein